MGKAVEWLWQTCPSSPTCPRVGRRGDMTLVQGYPVTDPALLADVPPGEVLSWLPAEQGVTVRLDEAALGDLVEGLTADAFRHEVLSTYDVPSDEDEVHRYLAGDDQDLTVGAEWRAWITGQVERGRRMRTVRVIHNTPGDYLRYECEWGYTVNEAAGMEIRMLDLTDVRPPREFLNEEFWMIDGERVAAMRYDATGRFLYADLIEGPAAHRHLAARDAAWDAAEPFASWWARHPEYHRQPHRERRRA